ncbi:MAG: transposase, partial [Armatimonadota bacterium]|nr:transposase [Armatimonadota bacterium]
DRPKSQSAESRRLPDELRPGRRHPHRLSDEGYKHVDLPMMVTCPTKHRRPVLVGSAAEIVIETLIHAAQRREARLFGYCAMPDHLHFAIRFANDDLPPRFLRYFKAEASRRVNVAWGIPGAFRWQRSYWDTFADDSLAVAEQVAYMMENPVRWGLCERPQDWPHSADLTKG